MNISIKDPYITENKYQYESISPFLFSMYHYQRERVCVCGHEIETDRRKDREKQTYIT